MTHSNELSETATQPQLALSNEIAATTNADATFMFVMLDLDVPPQNGTQRRVLLHALNTGFKLTSQTVGTARLLVSSAKGPAAYIGPGPPATDTIAHRYVQLLFEQPATLRLSDSDFTSITNRIGFDVQNFIATERLSAPIAGNFITVDGRAEAATPSGATPTGTGTGGRPTSSPEPFTGAAARSGKHLALAAVLGGLAVLAI